MTDHQHSDNCLMCAVRALTEGTPDTWWPKENGDRVEGVVLKMGIVSTDFGDKRFYDLWRGGRDRIRVMAYGSFCRRAIEEVAPQVGDFLTVWYDGVKTMIAGPMVGRDYRAFSANVQRGHSDTTAKIVGIE